MVKKFRQPATTQEAILTAFQEEHWVRCIDDPLRPRENVEARERLHATIKRLNQKQLHRLIVFKGDGTGQRVLWEWYTEEH